MKHKGLNQLLAAALINERFCAMLLHHPERAIAAGYAGQAFSLTTKEQDLVVGIRAERLEDLAAEVYRWISSRGSDGSFIVTGQPQGRSAPVGYPEPALNLAPMAIAA
jgi:hypothetical protein